MKDNEKINVHTDDVVWERQQREFEMLCKQLSPAGLDKVKKIILAMLSMKEKCASCEMSPNTALGLAIRNIEVLSKHRKESLDELYVIDFGTNKDKAVKEAYLQLDKAILDAIYCEAERVATFQVEESVKKK